MVDTIVPVTSETVARFVAYCERYGPEHDSSILPDAGFVPSPEQPSFLLARDGGDIGAVSLVRREPYMSAGRARFAIFHTLQPDLDAYQGLLHAIRPHLDGLKSVYLFLPEERSLAASLVGRLGFRIERYSFVLELTEPPRAEVRLPAGCEIVVVDRDDERRHGQYADLVNRNFAELAGHLVLTPDALRTWFGEETYLADGIRILLEDGVPVGTITISREYENRSAGEIGGLSVLPERRGRGLGRLLLRHGVEFAQSRGLAKVFLSVNGENLSALQLYLSEGFRLIQTVACYAMDCT